MKYFFEVLIISIFVIPEYYGNYCIYSKIGTRRFFQGNLIILLVINNFILI